MWVCVCYLLQGEVQSVSRKRDGLVGGFQITETEDLTGDDVGLSQLLNLRRPLWQLENNTS